ncbi:MAG TPA: hypothetical protein VNU01_10605 [Egibacteraceae bacterium]|nr:hypothetical protein [Egibacteraceae bacterium]
MASARRPEGPFPYPSTSAWRVKFAQALLDDPRVNLPAEAIEELAAGTLNHRELLVTSGGKTRFRPGLIAEHEALPGVTIYVLTATAHGAFGTVSPHNERIATWWPSPLDTSSPSDARLPERRRIDGHAAFVVDADSDIRLVDILSRTEAHLQSVDATRPYDLTEDLATNGQRIPAMYVATRILTADNTRLAWTALTGNNRTLRRLELFGLRARDGVMGAPVRAVDGDPDATGVYTDTTAWLTRLSARLNREVASETDQDSPAQRAAAVARVHSEFVVGCSDPDRLAEALHELNVREHVRGVHEYASLERHLAQGETVVVAYRREGLVDPVMADVLVGAVAFDALRGHQPNPNWPVLTEADLADDAAARTWRHRALIELLLPTHPQHQRIVRRAMGEPATSQLRKAHAEARGQTLAALQGLDQPKGRRNPRLGEHLTKRQAQSGISVSDRSLDALVADLGASSEELVWRLTPILAGLGLVEPDRGSANARGGARQAIEAVLAAGSRGRTFLSEALAAHREGRPPRRVDAGGAIIEVVADKEWVGTQDGFPRRPRPRPARPVTPPVEPDPPKPAREAFAELAMQVPLLLAQLKQAPDELRRHLADMADLSSADASVGLSPDDADQVKLELTNIGSAVHRLAGDVDPLVRATPDEDSEDGYDEEASA